MSYVRSQCFSCKHFNYKRIERNCKAFPKEIPIEIYHNEFDHAKPYEGDNGIQFEPRDENKRGS